MGLPELSVGRTEFFLEFPGENLPARPFHLPGSPAPRDSWPLPPASKPAPLPLFLLPRLPLTAAGKDPPPLRTRVIRVSLPAASHPSP